MRATVVYESLWGNTAAIARAIAEGLGDGAEALDTGAVSPEDAARADILVVGAPVHAMGLPTERTRATAASRAIVPGHMDPDLSHPSLREWLQGLPHLTAKAAAFDTRVRGILGRGGAMKVEQLLAERGATILAPSHGFIVASTQRVTEPGALLREGELARAAQWGASLAALAGASDQA